MLVTYRPSRYYSVVTVVATATTYRSSFLQSTAAATPKIVLCFMCVLDCFGPKESARHGTSTRHAVNQFFDTITNKQQENRRRAPTLLIQAKSKSIISSKQASTPAHKTNRFYTVPNRMTASLLYSISRGDELAPKRLMTRRSRPCEDKDDDDKMQNVAPPTLPKRYSPTPTPLHHTTSVSSSSSNKNTKQQRRKNLQKQHPPHAWFIIERGTSATFYVFRDTATGTSSTSSSKSPTSPTTSPSSCPTSSTLSSPSTTKDRSTATSSSGPTQTPFLSTSSKKNSRNSRRKASSLSSLLLQQHSSSSLPPPKSPSPTTSPASSIRTISTTASLNSSFSSSSSITFSMMTSVVSGDPLSHKR